MKKKITALLLLTAFITSCKSVPVTEIDPSLTAETAITTTAIETTAAVETTTTTVAETTTTTAETTVAAADPVNHYTDFSLSEYYPADETADIVSISGMGGMLNTLYEEKMEIARQAVYQSEYYDIVIDQAKELFDYNDGAYTLKEGATAFYSSAYNEYWDSAEPYSVKPMLEYTCPMFYDGENREYVFVFSIPLPLRYAEWSGENYFFVAVYLNHKDEAIIMDECCQQTMRSVTPLYVGRTVQLIFDSGHTQGTSLSIITGFKNGGYKVEFRGSAIDYVPSGANYILNDMSVWYKEYEMLCYDSEKGYVNVAAEELSGEAMDIICSSADVLSVFPDIAERCASGQVYVIGGKYITVSGNSTFTFENGEFKLFDGIIHPTNSENETIAIVAQ